MAVHATSHQFSAAAVGPRVFVVRQSPFLWIFIPDAGSLHEKLGTGSGAPDPDPTYI